MDLATGWFPSTGQTSREVSVVKIDPYLNEDAGTLSPEDHGEVFVLEDGTEVDLDFGHYERSLGSLIC